MTDETPKLGDRTPPRDEISLQEARKPPPEKAKAQLEFRLEEDNSISIYVYDPVAFDNYDPVEDGIIGLLEKMDPSSELVQIVTVLVSLGSFFPSVKKIVDVRTGRVMDVSGKDFTKGSGSSRTWANAHIKEVYEDRIERGIIDPKEFSFEEFEKEFRDNNP